MVLKFSPKRQKKKKNIPILGPNTLFFCDNCTLPIIKTRECPICKNRTKQFPLTPPYDARPAMKYDVLQIRELIAENFGDDVEIISEEDIVILNHIGSEDFMDEIFLQNHSIGVRRFDIISNKWIIKLNKVGLSLLAGKFSRKWVKVGDGAVEKIKSGASVLIPGVVDADPEINIGDYIVVINNEEEVIAGGIARINESDRHTMERGIYAKNYKPVTEKFSIKKSKLSWEEIIAWNQSELQKLEKESINFIIKIRDDLQLPVAVSYSGGKDSLVTLRLVMDALPDEDVKVLFADTGIEFPETIDYVKESSKSLNFEKNLVIESVPSDLFWEAFNRFGPPGRDFRYCCKFAKLAPIQKLIEQTFSGGQCISFIGQRRYESFQRAVTDIWQNQYIPNQINVSPIQNWTAFMIWLYILWKDLPYNPLYDSGYERIGCWVCPSSNLAQLQILEKSHPSLHNQLFEAVENWRTERNLPEEYWSYGLWRFKKIPKKIQDILPSDLQEEGEYKEKMTLASIQLSESECVTQPITVIGAFSSNIQLDKVNEALPIVGKVKKNQKMNYIRITNKKHSIILYGDGTFKISFKEKETRTGKEVVEVVHTFVYTVLRSIDCIGCGLCVGKCIQKAIIIEEEKLKVNEQLCNQCNQCFDACPIVTVVNKDIKKDIGRAIWLRSKK
ncbi:MAG: phosphoadenosine phosphosulfate reductase family protein [Candidatus Heimdallarchaeota archaeon]|nr:phosphoadenosine phosphosulfate reductase family protein [Candidatus Heimdallarchaeota archaeon]